MFGSLLNKGFSMEFKNGYTISVQFGTSNYCERRSFSLSYGCELKEDAVESKDAEVAIFSPTQEWVTKQVCLDALDLIICDSVVGWLDTDSVAILINYIKNLP